MREQSVDIVRAVYEAFGRGDVQAVLGALADELEWYEAEGMPYGGLYRDREAVAEKVFGPLIEDIPDFEVSPEEFIASGDTVVALVRYTGSGKATGKRLDLPVAHVWDIRNGKIARFRHFADTATFLEVVPVG
ncbi:MAG: nuclear transport factor 2 family protein [Actinomycetota bacterium]